MSITSFDGTVRVVKMPAIIDPIQNEKVNETYKSQTNIGLSAPGNTEPEDLHSGVTISGDLEGIEH
jgi:hypothetical protein